MSEIARSLFRFAGNRSLSILRCQKSFALYFATTEIAHSQFHDAESLALNFAMPEIAQSLFSDAGNCSLYILLHRKLLALYFTMPGITDFQFCNAGPLALNLVVVPEITLKFLVFYDFNGNHFLEVNLDSHLAYNSKSILARTFSANLASIP
jgi:hypothetical protein